MNSSIFTALKCIEFGVPGAIFCFGGWMKITLLLKSTLFNHCTVAALSVGLTGKFSTT